VGRASVTSEEGDGLYTVSLDYGTDEIAARIAGLDGEIASRQDELTSLTAQRVTEQARIADLVAAVNQAISANDGTPESIEAITDANTQLLTERSTLAQIEQDIAYNRIRIADLEARKASLQSLPLQESREMWCADYTLEKSGDVATIEINAEQPQILIAPGAPSPAAADGVMTHRLAMSGAATYLNSVLLPGVQRWSPGYRAGTLTAIDRENNTGTVDIGQARSSAQSLEINAQSVLTGVPFEYMSCNHAAFVVGDDVVVSFSGSWESPKIIGFQTNPKPCGPRRIIIPLATSTLSTTSVASGIGIPLMRAPVQFSPCVSGYYYTPKTPGEFPPGYIDGGIAPGVVSVSGAFTPITAGGGVIASYEEYGGLGSFKFDTDWQPATELQDLIFNPGGAAISVDELPISGIYVREFLSWSFNPATDPPQFDDFQFNEKDLFFSWPDNSEEDQAQLTCIVEAMASYFDPVPLSINLQPTAGGASITYDLYRWVNVREWPDHPEFPSNGFGDLCLGYRRREE